MNTSRVEESPMNANKPDGLSITKERVKAWDACSSGYRWFLKKFPQGGQFGEVYSALQADKRYEDSGWLTDKAFAELDAHERVHQIMKISGADKSQIEKLAADGDISATLGNWANAVTLGNRANAATLGEGANAVTLGNWANAVTTGYRANAATLGEGANAVTLGNWANAATLGEGANAVTLGNWANAATTGEGANAATLGEGANAATTGEGAVAAALGLNSKAKASHGGALCIVKRDRHNKLIAIFSSLVGQNGIEADKWYELGADSKPVEVTA